MKKDILKTEIKVINRKVRILRINENDYISLTDLARYANEEEPKIPVQTWMRNKNVVSFLGLWEKIHNNSFKGIEFTTFENEEDTLRLKSEVIEDFRHRVRRDKDIPVSKKYTDNMDCLLGTHIKLDEERSDKGHVLTTEECSELREEAIIIYIGESRKLFSSNMDKVVTKLDEVKQTRTTILYGSPKTKELT